ncbi:death-on-curing protein [Jatrophihabitans sp. GAS493]|uniref:type II toxin-antitoxin system death-on-curing family toxin n=1 Tax=Jatrophihabitans sp. GAS493 TaxID=1907575 RepID=UPI000BB89188|nr:Fic family protein [Jatrophihabitans sp. GAS493]SOD72527.1 death-on-curing protein [Jatrophihabitans sp. GAS493]
MTRYLDLDTAIAIAERAIGSAALVADYGLLDSALARPRATIFGRDAYPTLHLKAAALLHSLVNNHCLVDGNKRLGWLSVVVFCYINDVFIDADDNDAYDLVIAIADGSVDDLATIASHLVGWSRSLTPPNPRKGFRT